MPFRWNCLLDGGPVISVELTGREQRFEVPAETAPRTVGLDPNVRALAALKFGPR